MKKWIIAQCNKSRLGYKVINNSIDLGQPLKLIYRSVGILIVLILNPILKSNFDKNMEKLEKNDFVLTSANSQYGVNFYLPLFKSDFIQKTIFMSGTFYELKELKMVSKYLKKNAVILDIGANIGNHTLYYLICEKAIKVYCFEPMPITFSILKRNIKENRLEDKTVLFNKGVGDKCTSANTKIYDSNNLGITEIKYDDSGDLEIITIDSLSIKDSLDFVKIDTEGFEMQVLKGAITTLERFRPIISVEIGQEHFTETNNYLTNHKYELVECLSEGNYIYKHRNN